jgi:hypothetical protein
MFATAKNHTIDAVGGMCQDCASVPLPAAADKLHEAMYFYTKMMETYHEPEIFRFNLNAFIQSQRSIEDILATEMSDKHVSHRRHWLKKARERLEANTLLGKFRNLRNFVVHQGMLRAKSRAFVGIFKYRKRKLGFAFEVDPFTDSRDLLRNAVKTFAGNEDHPLIWIDEDHLFIGEEYGVERTWVVDELGDNDVLDYCRESFEMTQCVTRQAVGFARGFMGSHDLPSGIRVGLLTESDVDPSLIEKWGWS